jgi:hypothetical protein
VADEKKVDDRIFEGEFEFEAAVPEVFTQGTASQPLPDVQGREFEIKAISMIDPDAGKSVTINEGDIVDAADKLLRKWLIENTSRQDMVEIDALVDTPTGPESSFQPTNPISVNLKFMDVSTLEDGVTLLELITQKAWEQRMDEADSAVESSFDSGVESFRESQEEQQSQALAECEGAKDDLQTERDECNEKRDEQASHIKSVEEIIGGNALIIRGLQFQEPGPGGSSQIVVYGPNGDVLLDSGLEDGAAAVWEDLVNQHDLLTTPKWFEMTKADRASYEELEKIVLQVKPSRKGLKILQRRGGDKTLLEEDADKVASLSGGDLGAIIRGHFRARPAGQTLLPLERERIVEVEKEVFTQTGFVAGLGLVRNLTMSGQIKEKDGSITHRTFPARGLPEAEELLKTTPWDHSAPILVKWTSGLLAGTLEVDVRANGMIRDHLLRKAAANQCDEIVMDLQAEIERRKKLVTDAKEALAKCVAEKKRLEQSENILQKRVDWMHDRFEAIALAMGQSPKIIRATAEDPDEVFGQGPFIVEVWDHEGTWIATGRGENATEAWDSLITDSNRERFHKEFEFEDKKGKLFLGVIRAIEGSNPGDFTKKDYLLVSDLRGLGLPACLAGGCLKGLPECAKQGGCDHE